MASYLHDASIFTKMGFNLILQRLDSQPLVNVSVYDYMWNLTDPLVHVTRRLVPHLVPVENFGILSRVDVCGRKGKEGGRNAPGP